MRAGNGETVRSAWSEMGAFAGTIGRDRYEKSRIGCIPLLEGERRGKHGPTMVTAQFGRVISDAWFPRGFVWKKKPI